MRELNVKRCSVKKVFRSCLRPSTLLKERFWCKCFSGDCYCFSIILPWENSLHNPTILQFNFVFSHRGCGLYVAHKPSQCISYSIK